MKYTVISLFDGISCGQIALEKAGVKVEKYYASEIKKYAIKVTQNNYPNTIQIGSVIDLSKKEIKAMTKNKKVLLIGGSPCQGFSVAGKMKGSCTSCGIEVTTLKQYLELKKEGFEFDGQSYLFWEYVRVLKLIKKYSKEYKFLLENVRVTKKWLPMFNNTMGVEPVLINSSLVSAQTRKRYYWTNIEGVTQPEDRGVVLNDILDFSIPMTTQVQTQKIKNGVLNVKEATKKGYCEIYDGQCFDNAIPNSNTRRGRKMEFKSNCLLTSNKFTLFKDMKQRAFTPIECERLQTVPDNYTQGISDLQRYNVLGDGFTVEVISHILKELK